MLMTYTVREVSPEGSGCIHPKVGVQASVVEEQEDGSMEDPELMELLLRRSFSVVFLYAQCANKGEVATAAVRWKLLRSSWRYVYSPAPE